MQFDSSSTLPGGTSFGQARLSADSSALICKGEIIPFELTRSAGEFQRAGLSQGQKPFLRTRDWTPASDVSRVRTVGILGRAGFAQADRTSATVRGDVWSSVTQESLTNASTERSLSVFEPQ